MCTEPMCVVGNVYRAAVCVVGNVYRAAVCVWGGGGNVYRADVLRILLRSLFATISRRLPTTRY